VDQLADAQHVARRTRRGISWNLLGAVSTNAMRVVAIAVLGRMVTSEEFGVVAAAVSVNVILYSIRDVGVGQALVQRKHLEPDHFTTAFAVSLYLGLGLALGLLLAAPLIARLYHIPESADVIRVLGGLFALRGVSATSRMICQRELQFRAIAIVDAVAFAVGTIASIGAAVAGLGPWALVIGYVVEEALSTTMYLWVSPPRWSLAIDRARFRELMTFGTGQTVAQIAGILATYGDNFVVGNVLGARALGNYTRAYEWIKFPSTVFASIVGNVLFPAFARLQDQKAQLALSFRRVTFINALVLLPASAALIIVAPEAIRVLVGPGWDAAILPFRILAMTMLLRTNQKLGALVAQAAGAVNAVAVAFIVYMAVVVGGALLSIRWGIEGVAATTSIAIAVVCTWCMALAIRVSQIPVREVLGAHAPGLGLAALVAAVAWPLAHVLRATAIPGPALFVVVMVAAVAVCLGAVAILVRRGGGDFAWLATEIRNLRRRKGRG
jgi:PST family polysaccharide transporter